MTRGQPQHQRTGGRGGDRRHLDRQQAGGGRRLGAVPPLPTGKSRGVQPVLPAVSRLRQPAGLPGLNILLPFLRGRHRSSSCQNAEDYRRLIPGGDGQAGGLPSGAYFVSAEFCLGPVWLSESTPGEPDVRTRFSSQMWNRTYAQSGHLADTDRR
jgi:hypothetical protein